ncbi:hypothetical protein NXV86_21770 [Bacteroides sp. BFG-257]|nr:MULTISPECIES: hypothetical protein [Bacteroides]UVO97478.1 hypothetical protein NXV86_21770 [Bacteroides sp. BFG-257]
MAIFEIGTNFDNVDVSQEFVNRGVTCIGWNILEAPELYRYLEM